MRVIIVEKDGKYNNYIKNIAYNELFNKSSHDVTQSTPSVQATVGTFRGPPNHSC